MITPEENTRLRAYYAPFMQQCARYKDLLTAASLPLSVDLNELTAAYQQQLFDGLLKVDKGLQARYDLLRTDEARRQLVASTINLDGHDVIDEATAALRQLTTTYAQLERGGLGDAQVVPLVSFVRYYALDLGKLLDENTLDFSENQHVLDYFEAMAEALTPWLQMVRKTMNSGATMEHAGMLLSDFFAIEGRGLPTDKVVIKTKVLFARMQSQKLALHCPKP